MEIKLNKFTCQDFKLLVLSYLSSNVKGVRLSRNRPFLLRSSHREVNQCARSWVEFWSVTVQTFYFLAADISVRYIGSQGALKNR